MGFSWPENCRNAVELTALRECTQLHWLIGINSNFRYCNHDVGHAIGAAELGWDVKAVICLDASYVMERQQVGTIQFLIHQLLVIHVIYGTMLFVWTLTLKAHLRSHGYVQDLYVKDQRIQSFRCIHDVPLQSDGSSKLMRNNQNGQESASHEHLFEDSHSGKVSVSVADAGETAVVVSMIDREHCIKELREKSLSVGDINKNNQPLGKKSNIQPSVDAEETSLALSLSYDTHFSVPCDSLPHSESKIDFVDEAVSEPNVSDGCKLFAELSSSKPNNDREPSEIESDVDLHLRLSLRSSLPDNTYSDTTEYDPSEVSQTQKLVNECSLSVDNMGLDANEDGDVSSCVKRKSMSSRDCVLVTELTEADTTSPRDELGTEPPAKKAKDGRKSQHCVEHEVREPVSGSRQECTHLPEISKDKVDIVSSRCQMVDKSTKSISEDERECTNISAVSGDDKSKDVEEQRNSASDIMSIVRGTYKRPGRLSLSSSADKLMKERDTGAGLRVKKILRRAPEDESSKLEKLRKEIREAVRNRATKDDGQSKIFDPKLLLAFRNAIPGSRPEREPVRRLNPSFVRSKKSLLQKGKIRENLTKKIYGNSNGKRRRAWDRDWEVEFWKHRCRRATKPEKVETLKSVLDLLRRAQRSQKWKMNLEMRLQIPSFPDCIWRSSYSHQK
ncbi:hypothetical protein IFM89_019077 [Coptis chinensis]|uniref:Uncharacterized protein n=1 Tax=Coptis chinensis TaxID=261450 RepID=A0A835LNB6_9MAGN|nr:hypothetical protein IFM89_019077 [Coptis chinensis]